MASNGPSETFIVFLTELTERAKSSPFDASRLFSDALRWETSQSELNIPSNLLEQLIKLSGSFVINLETVAAMVDRLFDLPERNSLWVKMKALPMMQQKGLGAILLSLCRRYLWNWIKTAANKRGNQYELLSLICQLLAFIQGR